MSNLLAFRSQVEFDEVVCGMCGVVFFMPQRLREQRINDHETFYCPNGHARHYPGKTREEKLREELAAEQQRKVNALQRANEAEAQLRKKEAALERAKTEAKRVEKRIHAGVCTCCNRTFQNLARHMATKHNGEIKCNHPQAQVYSRFSGCCLSR